MIIPIKYPKSSHNYDTYSIVCVAFNNFALQDEQLNF